MVQAILDGRKTQTRRVVKEKFWPIFEDSEKDCPYGQAGDELWVRESWAISHILTGGAQNGFIYKANNYPESFIANTKWKPSIHMPKESCRLFLSIKSVRIERLHDISEEDARAEGILSFRDDIFIDDRKRKSGGQMRYKDYMADASGFGDPNLDYPTVGNAITSFSTLWTSINGQASWDENPWVWVVEFKKK